MLRSFLKSNPSIPEEGELYREIHLYENKFPIYYGYYDEMDRKNPIVDPMPVYPDFIVKPRFTPEGYRFVTKMQDACPYFMGDAKGERECAECGHYCHGEDLLGICKCEKQRKLP